ncbi:microviridin/marinostatin family tricyclic proteinase inhibitor [Gloeothece verrucosa]|uniref:Putative esterase n=1 Tax=Gloeothece verrucosa (strain PCC 7822) TaxID=497965 RepID=E0UGC4_GLOV7|nr:microviridin/marinostatin family tricyclic proteinase inhibitor [Gloeothece verrucosa]ADN16743.1 putative esterase [Gloeothece verrucosa PCC 7822]
MSNNAAALPITNAKPFFARFLATQEETPPTEKPAETPAPFPFPEFPPIFTLKFPSDWEDS